MAADQIAIQIPKTRWKEGSAFSATAYFRNRATAAADAPAASRYRIDCLTTGRTIADWTTISPAANITISVTSAHNAILSDCNDRERKQLTVEATDECREAVVWTVENLYGTT